MIYTVSRQDCTGATLGTVESDKGIGEAAQIAARRFYNAEAAIRVTGDWGKSGCFRVTRRVENDASTSLGEQFHVVER